MSPEREEDSFASNLYCLVISVCSARHASADTRPGQLWTRKRAVAMILAQVATDQAKLRSADKCALTALLLLSTAMSPQSRWAAEQYEVSLQDTSDII